MDLEEEMVLQEAMDIQVATISIFIVNLIYIFLLCPSLLSWVSPNQSWYTKEKHKKNTFLTVKAGNTKISSILNLSAIKTKMLVLCIILISQDVSYTLYIVCLFRTSRITRFYRSTWSSWKCRSALLLGKI